MAIIDSIVQIQITRQTAQIDITSFDIPLLMVEMDANVASFATERVKTYTSLDAVADDLGVNHVGYLMAQKLLSGDIKPNQFKIGKVVRDGANDETYVEALNLIQDLDDTWYAVIAQSHDDDDIANLASVIQAQRKLYFTSTASQLAYLPPQPVTYTSVVDFGDLSTPVDGDIVSIVIAGETYTSTYVEDEDVPADSDWSPFLGTPTQTFVGDFEVVGNTVVVENSSVNYTITRANKVMDGETTAAISISPTDPIGLDIGQRLKAMGYTRTIVMFSNTADAEYPEAVWVGGNLPYTPGNITWEYKQLPGVTVSRLTANQINVLEGRGYNYYIPVKGINITRRGKVAEGEWIDTMQIVDWVYARLQEQIFYRLATMPKIAFTDVGFTIIENEIRSVLSQAQANNAIDTFSVTTPRALSVPEMQRAQRIAGDFKFEARLAGAVSIVRIQGSVNY